MGTKKIKDKLGKNNFLFFFEKVKKIWIIFSTYDVCCNVMVYMKLCKVSLKVKEKLKLFGTCTIKGKVFVLFDES